MPISKYLIMVVISVMTSPGCNGFSRDNRFVKVVTSAMMTKGFSCVFEFHRLDNNCYNMCLKRGSLCTCITYRSLNYFPLIMLN